MIFNLQLNVFFYDRLASNMIEFEYHIQIIIEQNIFNGINKSFEIIS